MVTALEKKAINGNGRYLFLKKKISIKLFKKYLKNPNKPIKELAKEEGVSSTFLHKVVAKGLKENWSNHNFFHQR